MSSVKLPDVLHWPSSHAMIEQRHNRMMTNGWGIMVCGTHRPGCCRRCHSILYLYMDPMDYTQESMIPEGP